MIPLKLRLRNFMCYRDPSPLDLTGIHLACLAGDNGHGKSALLDAMTWALWGRSRARSEDELVTLGQRDMEVEFEFLLGTMHYRVLRKRQLGRTSKSALEFQAKEAAAAPDSPRHQLGGDEEFHPFSGATLRETQARIIEVLRMDYDTFVNSALLLQGRADEFTVKTPADRKGILAEILGLSVYDEYEGRAKELAKEKEQAEREVGARIQEIGRELEHRPEYESELEATQAELARLTGEVKVAETALQDLRGQVKTLEAQKVQLAEVNKRIQTSESQLGELDDHLQQLDQRVTAYQSILERREAIQDGYEQLLQARQQDAEYNAKVAQLLSLKEEQATYEKQIAEAQQSLELKKHVLEAQLSELEKLTKQRPAWEADQKKATKELEELAALQVRGEEGKQRIKTLSNEASSLKARNAQLKVELAALKDKVDLLSVLHPRSGRLPRPAEAVRPASCAGQAPTASCPLCGQSLHEAERQRLLAEFEKTGAEQRDLHRKNASRLKEIDSELSSAETEGERIARELRRLPALQGRAAMLSKSLQDAQQASIAWESQHGVLLALQQQLEQRDFAAAEQRQLAAVQKRVAALGYDKSAHDQVRQALARLASLETDKAELDKAQQAITQLRENRQQLQQARAQWVTAMEGDHQRQAELSQALAGVEELARNLEIKARQTDELHSQEGRARQVVGAAQQKLDYCGRLAGEQQERSRQRKNLAEERNLYEELQLAFGKKGLQALIIEAAIPELEEEANALLGRMTEGRMNLHFDTQRDTKAGNVIETLDIKIADENGLRSYEMYSGGEAFRINFAVRIALSKLLARRAGAQLQTLIIDEGFGTQDADGRQKLVEAINSIKDDFARILVITHIEELQDAFPVRIDVYKTEQGSQIRMS
jgi:exonuclease SbcC